MSSSSQAVESQLQRALRPNVTVHNYTPQRSTSPPPTGRLEGEGRTVPRPSPTSLVAEARALVESCIANCGVGVWKDVEWEKKGPGSSGNVFEFRYRPPTIPGVTTSRPLELREWGAPVTNDELWSLNELEEFVHVKVAKYKGEEIARASAGSTAGPSKKRTRDAEESSSKGEAPSPKRRKTFYGLLHDVIPHPHIRPTPILSPSQSESTKIREYKRLPPICLPPHSDPLPPPNVYDRAAWIIPLRGTLPWRDATSAYLLDDSIHDPLDPDIHAVRPIPAPLKSQEPIYWTRPAIAAFWEFLSSLQEGGRVGALGLSFHAARSANISTQTDAELNREISASVHQENTTKDGDSHTSADSASTSARTSCSSPLSSLDYIKVYHPANKSMYVRAALDIWKYEHETWKGGDTGFIASGVAQNVPTPGLVGGLQLAVAVIFVTSGVTEVVLATGDASLRRIDRNPSPAAFRRNCGVAAIPSWLRALVRPRQQAAKEDVVNIWLQLSTLFVLPINDDAMVGNWYK
ncbi:hypothetical protein CC1G_06943 [Coprinopsis cinerea okayama7|uniref:Uncharacterized protein n=1 Tax=Coprinopsis cinerea (strain Okayama-7 / 130 / ATCC MYA-4618 / FGSC 9003) TaxID=240176 RepID=A8NZS5_COPC7|nr:hypothetical protein CC1G_06943 [Coprinopsis cinerea okayama7\|eukprot:XP_001837737.2 hypothetical protein CC1G_06943 [Coprinopsis cinerea okayama7\